MDDDAQPDALEQPPEPPEAPGTGGTTPDPPESVEPPVGPEDGDAAGDDPGDGDRTVQRLHKEAAKHRARAREERERADAADARVRELEAALSAEQGRARTAALADAKRAVAARLRIPAGLADRIAGDTIDDMTADAARLANQLRWLTELPAVGIDPGPPAGRAETLDSHYARVLHAAANRNGQGPAADMARVIQGRQ